LKELLRAKGEFKIGGPMNFSPGGKDYSEVTPIFLPLRYREEKGIERIRGWDGGC
jgi:hypothetical protein